MSGIRDHSIYEFDVEYTTEYRPVCENDTRIKVPGNKKTVRIIADKNVPAIAEAHLLTMFRHCPDPPMQILGRRVLDIAAFIETHIW